MAQNANSTVALGPSASNRPLSGGRLAAFARNLDLVLLAAALAVFVAAGFPLLGYAVAGAAWLAQRAIQVVVARRAAAAIVRGERRAAFGAVATSSIGRLWMLTLPILVAGIIEREAGLAGAILAAALVTADLAGEALAHWAAPEAAR